LPQPPIRRAVARQHFPLAFLLQNRRGPRCRHRSVFSLRNRLRCLPRFNRNFLSLDSGNGSETINLGPLLHSHTRRKSGPNVSTAQLWQKIATTQLCLTTTWLSSSPAWSSGFVKVVRWGRMALARRSRYSRHPFGGISQYAPVGYQTEFSVHTIDGTLNHRLVPAVPRTISQRGSVDIHRKRT